MKSPLLLLACLASAGCNHAASTKALESASKDSDHNVVATYSPEPARRYHLKNGVSMIMEAEPNELAHFNHVTIAGAVLHPGTYYFEGQVPLEDVVTTSQPFPGNPDHTHRCGSAALNGIIINSAVVPGVDYPGKIQINYIKYMEPKPEGTPRKRILMQGGDIYIPEWF